MAIKKISDFPSVKPASSDKILIEQGGEGKSATLADLPVPLDVQRKLNNRVNYSDSLTYEEIMATNPVPDLTNKVASASALKAVGDNVKTRLYEGVSSTTFDSIYSQMKTGMRAVYISGEGDYYIIQIYRTATEGCQIRIGYSSGNVQRRMLIDGTWSSWATV